MGVRGTGRVREERGRGESDVNAGLMYSILKKNKIKLKISEFLYLFQYLNLPPTPLYFPPGS